ncbi:MAG: PAS domain S-box protein [Candidatus Methanoperedens sp.]|nr:PAS domain S-box protein [Candidatus Methanoperedens sp.]
MSTHFRSIYEKSDKNKLEELLLEQEEKSILSEKYLWMIIESSLYGIAVVDENGKFEFGNDSFFRTIDWLKEEIIGQDFMKVIPDDSKEFVTGHWQGVQKDRGGFHEIKIKTRCGTIKYLNVSSTFVEIKGNNKVVAIIHDITENKKQEMKLKESEEKYRDLFENAQDAMYVVDDEGNFLKMNKIGLQTLGCVKEEVIGTNISKWITQESLKTVNMRRKKFLSGEKLDQIDIIEIVCKNGEHRWCEIKIREIKEGNKTIEIHGIARDITENRLLKQEIKKSNKQQKLLCYLIQGTRGGKTRALILKHLNDRSYNAHQLSTVMNMDYKTIRHHLNVLIKNGIIGKGNNGYSDLYSISKNMEADLNTFNEL